MVLYPSRAARGPAGLGTRTPWFSAQRPCLMAAATAWIPHRISGRIHRLQHQVARIAKGDFRELSAASFPPHDEVHDLARSIDPDMRSSSGR